VFPTYRSIGKRIRFNRIMGRGRAIIFAFDHGVEHGPSDFPEDRIDPRIVLTEVVEAGVDAVMLLPGVARLTSDIWGGRTSLILKLTSKTNLRPEEYRLIQSIFGFVEDAIALDADAVAATIYWGSPFEDEMLEIWFNIREAADHYGLPCLQLAYPRGPTIKDRFDVEIVRYGARAAAESGADLIKTYYTGSRESFAKVVEAASGVPVLMSGGPKTPKAIDFLKQVRNVIDAGGKGVVVGRNVFQAPNIKSMIKAIQLIVYEDRSPEEAVKVIK